MPALRVLHVAAECAPFAKVGGLGDVVGALPVALAAEGVEASIVMPLYGGPDGPVAQKAGPLALVSEGTFAINADEGTFTYRVWRSDSLPRPVGTIGAPVFFIDETYHFGDHGVYFRVADGMPFGHAGARFVAFQLAVLDWLGSDASPEVDVLHLHDNHAALIPTLQRHGHDVRDSVRSLPTVFTVHSADHQGELPRELWDRLGLDVPDSEALRTDRGEVNAMRAAVQTADAITTVSPSYAEELAASDEVAHGLADAFRDAGERLVGVLNGIDPAVWSPQTDAHLPHLYSAADLSGKAETKAALCAELNLDPSRPLLSFVGRLMPEKGIEVLLPGVDEIIRNTEANVALLGTGDPEHEAEVRGLAGMLERDGFGGRLAAVVAFDERLAHRFYAAADIFLMPSRSEPCGLGQMYAMAYGTPPVVHAVGGLRDTVRSADPDRTGICFEAFTPEAFVAAVRQALALHADAKTWADIQQTGMAADFTWRASARTYVDLYRHVIA